MSKKPSCDTKTKWSQLGTLIAVMAIASAGIPASAAQNEFGPSNPFYSESTLPFAAQWNQNRLAYERNELAGDEKFFDLLEETIQVCLRMIC